MEKKNIVLIFGVLGLSILFLIVFFSVFVKDTTKISCVHELGIDYPKIVTNIEANFVDKKISECSRTVTYEFESVSKAQKYYEGIKAPHISLTGNKVVIVQDCLEAYKSDKEYRDYNGFIKAHTDQYYICK